MILYNSSTRNKYDFMLSCIQIVEGIHVIISNKTHVCMTDDTLRITQTEARISQ